MPKLISLLHRHEVNDVLIISVAAALQGVAVEARGFDIAPSLEQGNLSRLAVLLVEIDSRLPDGESSHWVKQSNGERKWIMHGPPSPEELARRAKWAPNPENFESMDSLFYTRYGNFDVVPDLIGSYEELIKRG